MVRLMIDDLYDTMPWDKLDAVVFDVGNVLLSFSPEKLLREYLPGEAALHTRLMNKIFRTPYWMMLDHGLITTEEAVSAMAGRDRELLPLIRTLMMSWPDLKEVIPEGVNALRACKAHGKRLYVLSNYHGASFDHVRKKYDFFDLFDGFVVSASVKLLKPDPAIYDRVTDEFGLEPARTLFIDDTPINIEGALHAGWQGFCLNEPGKLARFIGEEGVHPTTPTKEEALC